MNTDWDKAIEFVLGQEGGYDPSPVDDPGGETNFGISKRSYPNLDIKSLTVEQAKKIYFSDYWEACNCDQLPTYFALPVFDCAVNQGTGKAARLLQIALDVNVDGKIGPQTVTAAYKVGANALRSFLVLRLLDYTKNSNFQTWGNTWFNRVLAEYKLVFEYSK